MVKAKDECYPAVAMRQKTSPHFPLFLLSACLGSLALALAAQYGLGLKPCILCLIQRIPFAIAAVSALVALWRPRLARPALALAGLVLLINGGIAVYHVGVEQKWWLSACVPETTGPIALQDLAAQMSKPVEARCDEPAWSWNGITMAAMNIVFSPGLGLLVLAWVGKKGKRA